MNAIREGTRFEKNRLKFFFNSSTNYILIVFLNPFYLNRYKEENKKNDRNKFDHISYWFIIAESFFVLKNKKEFETNG